MKCLGLNIVEWIQVVAAIATFWAAIAAWKSSNAAKLSASAAAKQLDEMKQTRLDAQKPNVLLNNTNDISLIDNEVENIVSIPLFNAGNGAVMNLKGTISILDDFLTEFAATEKAKSKLNFKKELSDEINVFSFNKLDSTIYFVSDEEIDGITIPYIKKDSEISVDLPNELKRLIEIYIPISPVPNCPKLNFLIELVYEDSFHNLYKKSFKVQVRGHLYLNNEEFTYSYYLAPSIIK